MHRTQLMIVAGVTALPCSLAVALAAVIVSGAPALIGAALLGLVLLSLGLLGVGLVGFGLLVHRRTAARTARHALRVALRGEPSYS